MNGLRMERPVTLTDGTFKIYCHRNRKVCKEVVRFDFSGKRLYDRNGLEVRGKF